MKKNLQKMTRKNHLTVLIGAAILSISLSACGQIPTVLPMFDNLRKNASASNTTTDAGSTEASSEIQNKSEQPSNAVLEAAQDTVDAVTDTIEEVTNSAQSVVTQGSLEPFDTTANIDETVLYDENDIRIVATGIEYSGSAAKLMLHIENNTDSDLDFGNGFWGDEYSYLNSYMMSGYLWDDIAAGTALDTDLSFNTRELSLFGIHRIAEIDFALNSHDDDYNHTDYGPFHLTTKGSEDYDMSQESFQANVTNPIFQKLYETKVLYASDTPFMTLGNVIGTNSTVIENKDGDTRLYLDIVNNESYPVIVTATPLYLNDTLAYEGTCLYANIAPGKHAVEDLSLDYFAEEVSMNVQDINEVKMTVTLYDEGKSPINIADVVIPVK